MKHDLSSDSPSLLDSENATELARLLLQDRFLTQAMGGPLAEQHDVATMQRVLDVGCGPGGWVLDVAFAYPRVQVIGIDVSPRRLSTPMRRHGRKGWRMPAFR